MAGSSKKRSGFHYPKTSLITGTGVINEMSPVLLLSYSPVIDI